jgi:hypothetical protein
MLTISATAFAKRTSLRTFSIPLRVVQIDRNCFDKRIHLYRLKFQSSESLTRVVGDRSLENALDEFGVSSGSGLLTIIIAEGGVDVKFAESVYVHNVDEDSELSLVRDLQ